MMDSRAWCLQEALLSKQILLFQHTRVVYSCLEGVTSENGESSAEDWSLWMPHFLPAVHKTRRQLHSKSTLTAKELWPVWKDVNTTSGDKYTSVDDKLLAI